MTRQRAHRAACAALVVPLILLVGFRSAWALYACRTDGVVRSSCCCAKKHEHRAPPPGPVVSRGACTVTSSAPQVRDTERAGVTAPPALVAIAETPAPRAPTARAIAIDHANARPPPVASFLQKQAFLR